MERNYLFICDLYHKIFAIQPKEDGSLWCDMSGEDVGDSKKTLVRNNGPSKLQKHIFLFTLKYVQRGTSS